MRRPLAPFAVLLLAVGAAEAQQSRVAEIQIAPRYLRMRVDAVAQVVATAYDADGIPVNAAFTWSSSNINVADVTPEGFVRGVAPGAAVVTAATGTGAARRVGQVSVFVMRGERVWVAPAPPAPGAPPTGGVQPAPTTPPPGVWVGPSPPSRAQVDSMVRASVDCADPFMSAVNPGRACWDERARLLEPARLVLSVSVKGSCPWVTRGVTSLMVHVLESGQVEDVRVYGPTGCPAVDSTAEATARSLTFTPAQRGGRPHRSWVRLMFRTEP
jgi:TonB family protein